MVLQKKNYMSLEEVAELLGVNYQLIYRLVRSGDLPALKLGRIYRVDEADLEQYLEQAKCVPSAIVGKCEFCGRSYSSANSLRHACKECDASICIDCWERQGITYCSLHNSSQTKKS